jgi:hypothetical protein
MICSYAIDWVRKKREGIVGTLPEVGPYFVANTLLFPIACAGRRQLLLPPANRIVAGQPARLFNATKLYLWMIGQDIFFRHTQP